MNREFLFSQYRYTGEKEKTEIFECVAVSAGVRVTLVLLSPQDYLKAVQGITGNIFSF